MNNLGLVLALLSAIAPVGVRHHKSEYGFGTKANKRFDSVAKRAERKKRRQAKKRGRRQ